jgi:hypothetical protein
MMCKGASVRDTTPGASSTPPAIAASSPSAMRSHPPTLEVPIGADLWVSSQEFRE